LIQADTLVSVKVIDIVSIRKQGVKEVRGHAVPG
jgi:hypothetical protein